MESDDVVTVVHGVNTVEGNTNIIACAGGRCVTTGQLVPFCLFTDPQLARVGLSEREAMERGIHYRLFKVPMTAV